MEKDFVAILCEAIKQRRKLHFYYQSASGNIGWRKIRPYMIFTNNKGNVELVGLPEEELKRPIGDREAGHYLVNKLDIKQFRVLSKTFSDAGVPREIVVNTQVQPICRFIYNDEDEGEVSKGWTKIL